MPTAAKLVSALGFALVALWATLAYVPQLPEGADLGYLRQIMLGLGAVIGWWGVGRQVGRGYGAAAGYGLRGAALIVLWALLGFSTYIMLTRSMRRMYQSDPGRALLDVPRIMIDYGRLLMAQEVILALVVGGLAAGLIAEWTARRWS